jgi:hypothetical protein
VLKGAFVDWLFARGVRDAHMRFYCWLIVATLPVAAILFFLPNPTAFLILYGVLQLVVIPYTLYASATISVITPATPAQQDHRGAVHRLQHRRKRHRPDPGRVHHRFHLQGESSLGCRWPVAPAFRP